MPLNHVVTNVIPVCLSLLGTWPGPKWLPGESTILQVLISIQAMIFCENPSENEPGRNCSNDNNHRANAIYRTTTAKFAILRWAMDPPTPWKDEVAFHFQKKADAILRTVEQWTRESRATPPRNLEVDGYYDLVMDQDAIRVDIGTVLQELHKALNRYGATYKPEHFAPQRGGNSFGRGGMYGGPRRGGGGFGGGHGLHFGGNF
jgi:hypothetical protein